MMEAAGSRLGLNLATVEGRLAATAYALVQEGIMSGGYPVLPKHPDTPEEIDGIIARPNPELSGVIRGFGPYKGQEMTLLTGQDGHWVILNPDDDIIAVSNRNIPLRDRQNDLQEIIRPLE